MREKEKFLEEKICRKKIWEKIFFSKKNMSKIR